MSTSPEALAILGGPCGYCGGYHTGLCPRVKAIEYHGNGTVARVEFHDTTGGRGAAASGLETISKPPAPSEGET